MGNLARGYRAKSVYEMNKLGKNGLNSQTLLMIKLPHSRFLRILSRSLFIVMVVMASLGFFMRSSFSNALHERVADSENGFEIFTLLFRDLVDEGLIKKGQKGLILGAEVREIDDDFEFLRRAGIDLVAGKENMEAHRLFDFMFVSSFGQVERVDSSIKDGGLVISQLGNDPSNELQHMRSNYGMVYLRRIENTMVALRKVGALQNDPLSSPTKRVLCTEEKKKAALKRLEAAYLEPPRPAPLAKNSRFTSRKIKFLPDLLKDTLEGYPRRVFITDDSSALDWFYKNYPMRDQEFEVYDVEIEGGYEGFVSQETGVSAWLKKNVRRKDYVVMKAEAQMVEEMLKDKSIGLVDELFLECKNQWHGTGSKRAYWQCLALYGKVRDEGIAVHQWWS